MSLNFESVGVPIAFIGDGKKKKLKQFLSVAEHKKDVKNPYLEYTLQGEEQFLPIPDPNKERSIIYISGQSGSGKSYWVAEWCKRYKQLYPKNNIYLLSSLEEDSSIDRIKDLYRIKLPEFMEDNWIVEDLKDSCIILDDTDAIIDKNIKKKIDILLNSILQVGRHHNTTCLFTSHLATCGKETKMILAECHSVVLFPKNMGNRSLKYILESYFGLDNKEIKKLKNLEGRWVQINRTYPKSILSEKYACLPALLD
jgi:hypothetical protein